MQACLGVLCYRQCILLMMRLHIPRRRFKPPLPRTCPSSFHVKGDTNLESTIDLDSLPMRVAVGQLNELTDEHLAFAVQVGVQDIQLNTPKLPGETGWEYEDLSALRARAEGSGLRLIA